MSLDTEHVFACDPGGRSGFATARMGLNRFEFTGGGVLREDMMPDYFARQQMVGMQDSDAIFGEWARAYDVMVYESWYPREQNGSMEWIKGSPLTEAQQIGALRWIARASGAKIITQHPSDKPMAVATMPDVLAQLNRDSNEQHDQDARMHLWLYFWRNWYDGSVRPADTVIL